MNYEIEEFYKSEGYEIICGVDEAGRGPLAGPVCAAAVILPPGLDDLPINDSKKLSEKKRDELFGDICKNALAYSIAFVDEKEIDEINILNATFKAMCRAIDGLSIASDLVLVDGNKTPGSGKKEIAIVKGDSKSISIAAASILAKVSRDNVMYELDKKYPEYQFAKHKGYGTKLHYEMIKKYGISPVHRLSFLKNLDKK